MTNPIYFLEENYGRYGNAFRETDRDSNSRAFIVELIRSGQVHPIKVLEVCEDEGSCRDITDSIMSEVAALLVTNRMSPAERQAAQWDHDRKIRAESSQ